FRILNYWIILKFIFVHRSLAYGGNYVKAAIGQRPMDKNEFQNIKLLDNSEVSLISDRAEAITEAAFHPLYIGPVKNEIKVQYNLEAIDHRLLNEDLGVFPNSNDLKISVDTTRILGSLRESLPYPPPPPLSASQRNSKKYLPPWNIKAYPVFLKNISLDTLIIGHGEFFHLMIEAKDSLGKWKPIQQPYIYFCGFGLTDFYLAPGEIALSSCKLFKGDYQTQMRLVFRSKKKIYSNEFKARMNYDQFKKPEDDG
ncbi:MAG: hypothetical protein AAFU64_14740, partial [Bacteroidota bacterium]